MKTDYFLQITDVFNHAFHNLGLDVRQEVLESLTHTIHQAMSLKGRYYHTCEHALTLSDPQNPIQSLAALFHDVVNYPVDQGFSPDVWQGIASYLGPCQEDEAQIRFVEHVPVDDSGFHLVREIFGFSCGQTLFSTSGYNEILSSLVMAKKLEQIVPQKVLLQSICYIEASIPFRPRDENEVGPFEGLADRLGKVARNYHILISEGEIEKTIQGAVTFANQDVENFTACETSLFLDNTWKLLAESNPALRRGSVYSLRDYRQALHGMKDFLCSIVAQDVLHEFKGLPPRAEIQEQLIQVRKNLTTGCGYLEIKLLTIAILEALAEITGGDAPVALFLGKGEQTAQAKRLLGGYIFPARTPAAGVDTKGDLVKLLKSGRIEPVDDTDVKTSPLALYIYQGMGFEKVQSALGYAYQMFAGQMEPAEFLQVLDPSMLAVIAEACAHMTPERREKLLAYAMEKLDS